MERFSKIQKLRKINEQEITLPKKDENKEEEVKKDVESKEEETNTDSTAVKLFSKLFEARQMAHIFHLQSKAEMGSGWEHEALNTFYTELLELIDELIETYQGQYGTVTGYEVIDSSATGQMKSLDYLKQTIDHIKNEKKVIDKEDSHLLNIVDEISALFYRTIFKLTNLK